MEMRKENNVIGDTIITKKLSSGMKCYIIPKNGYGEKMAVLCTKFGSNDIVYRRPTEEQKHNMPLGTAHFIEHKLFEQSWGDAFTAFSKQSATANAFTDFQKTAYYFSCQKNFELNLKLLLSFVQHTHFTEQATEQEKKIIASEITMYQDEPSWIVFFNLLENMYHNHTVKNPIAGTVNSIQQVTKEVLQKSYEAYYTPENFCLVCAGDIQSDEILEMADKIMKPTNGHRAVSLFEKEPESVVKQYCQKDMSLIEPIFQIGFKQKPQEESKSLKQIYLMRMAMDILAGESSLFFEKAYQKEWIQQPVDCEFFSGDGYAFTAFSATGKYAQETAELLLKEIEKIQQEGISQEVFERAKSKQVGRMVRGFNSIYAICMSQLELALKNRDLFDGFHTLKGIKKEEVQRVFQKDFLKNNMTVSVVK
ncbi:MAG: insulinase family protein [Firmicutes bacterium]|nr:insulinase family protein [Bacillota bacterium]